MAADWKALGKRFNDEVMTQGKVEVIDELVTDDFLDHQTMPGMPPGKEGVRAFVKMFRDAFPDLKVETVSTAVDGDELWMHSIMTGTHKGELGGIAPTGKTVTVEMFDRLRIAGDKAAEHWGVSNDLGMMTQLGVVPEMG